MHHPTNKFQRKLIEEKKHLFVEKKKGTIRAERPSRVGRKIALVHLKEKETEQELRDASSRESNQPSASS